MASRVTVNIVARDLTRAQVARIRENFRGLGRDFSRFANDQSARNLDRLDNRFNEMNGHLQSLRGNIPDDEFNRLNDRLQTFRTHLDGIRQNGAGADDIALLRQHIRDLGGDFNRLNTRTTIHIRTRDDTEGGFRRARRTVGRGIAGLAAIIVKPLAAAFDAAGADGIARGLNGALQNPYVAAGIAALVASVLGLIGSAIGGILVFAFGAAFVGLGAFLAAKSEAVKKQWGKTAAAIKKDFAGVGEAMEPAVLHAMKVLEDLSDQFAPHLKKALEEADPHVQKFTDSLAEAFRKFGKAGFDPMMEAFNVLLDSLGPELETFFEHLGESFAFLAESVKKNSDETALAIRLVLEIITGLIYIIGGLVQVWGFLVRQVELFTESLQNAWAWVSRNWNQNSTWTWRGIETLVGWVKTLWNWVNRNCNRVSDWKWRGLMELVGWIKTAWHWINRNWNRISAWKIKGIDWVIGKIRDAWGWVNRNWNRVISFSIAPISIPGSVRKLLGLAHGGVRGYSAAATGGARSNMTLVGEQGPELVNLAPGSHVRSNPDSRRIMHQSTVGGASQIVIKSSGRRADDLLLEILRDAIHQRGGNPVTVLGG